MNPPEASIQGPLQRLICAAALEKGQPRLWKQRLGEWRGSCPENKNCSNVCYGGVLKMVQLLVWRLQQCQWDRRREKGRRRNLKKILDQRRPERSDS